MNPSEMRILVVDDDANILNGTARLLENAGYAVDRAATGEAALQAVRDHRPDLLLLDRHLPDINGLEVCRRIKQEPAQADIFVVMISASSTKSEEQAEGLESGADGYIARPIANRELLARVAAYIRIFHLTRSLRLQAEELKKHSEAADQAQLASLNLMEDAVAARERAEQASRALRESEYRWKFAVEGSGDGLWDWDVPMGICFFTKRWKEMLGLAEDEVGNTVDEWRKRVHPDDLAPAMAAVQAHFDGTTPHYFNEHRALCKDGSWKWILDRGLVVSRDAGGKPLRMIGTHSDITARKRVETALRDSRDLIVKLTAQVPGMVFQYQLHPDGHASIPLSSSGINDIYEVTPEEVREDATPLHRRHHPDDYDRIVAAIQESARTQRPFHCEFRVVLPRQGLRWRLCDSSPERMEDGSTLWHGIASDITERKRREEERARLAMAVEQSAETIVITDASGTILYANPAFEKTSGYTCVEALGQNPRMLKSGQHDAEFYRQLWAVLGRGEVWTGRLINKKKDGTLYEEDASISPVRDAVGKIVNYVAVKRDVTREAQLEEQLRQSQKMEAIGQLSGGVAHDFNNILTAMIMQTELTGMVKNLPGEVQEGLRQIRAAAERAANLTRQLLLFSRKQVMQPRELDLNAVVTSLANMLQRIIGEDVSLQLNLHSRAQITRADPGMLDQVLMNLVVNARDAMPGGGQIFIETGEKTFTKEEATLIPDAKPGPYVSLRVTDTGCGIAPENLARIFEPFFTTKEPGKGTGLGLATVFGIVKQHGGSLMVESKVGRGTTFQVFLRATASVGQSPAAVKPKPRGGTETILLVEDEAAVRTLTRAVLEQFGYRVLEASDGVEALRIWEENQDSIHLLFTDLVMPKGVRGHELAARLQARSPKLRVVFTSGYSADIAGRQLSLQEGQNFIQKPSSYQQLLETVRRCLDS